MSPTMADVYQRELLQRLRDDYPAHGAASLTLLEGARMYSTLDEVQVDLEALEKAGLVADDGLWRITDKGRQALDAYYATLRRDIDRRRAAR